MSTTTTLVPARELRPGTVCEFPFNRTATVAAIRLGRLYAYITWTEPAAPDSRVELDWEFYVQVSDMNASETAAYLDRQTTIADREAVIDYLTTFHSFTTGARWPNTYTSHRSIRVYLGKNFIDINDDARNWSVRLTDPTPLELFKLTLDWADKYSLEQATATTGQRSAAARRHNRAAARNA
jgi:hypothetical protein